MDSVSTNSLMMDPRPRFLHIWGSSLLAVAQKTYRQAVHLHGPLGFFARTLASVGSPILHPMQCTGLAIVSYIDDLLLEMEDLTMTVFPPSAHVFRLVDEVALLVESLPELFDDGNAGVGNEMIVSEEVDGWDKKTAIRKNMEEEIEEVEEIVEEVEETATSAKEGKDAKVAVVLELMKDPILDLFDEGWVKEGKNAKVAAVHELMKDPILDLFDEGWVKQGKDAKVVEVQELIKDPILDLFDEGWAGGRKRVVL